MTTKTTSHLLPLLLVRSTSPVVRTVPQAMKWMPLLLLWELALTCVEAFAVVAPQQRATYRPKDTIADIEKYGHIFGSQSTSLCAAEGEGNDDGEQETVFLERGSEEDVFTSEQWDDIEAGQPSQLMIMKDVSTNPYFWILIPWILATTTNKRIPLFSALGCQYIYIYSSSCYSLVWRPQFLLGSGVARWHSRNTRYRHH